MHSFDPSSIVALCKTCKCIYRKSILASWKKLIQAAPWLCSFQIPKISQKWIEQWNQLSKPFLKAQELFIKVLRSFTCSTCELSDFIKAMYVSRLFNGLLPAALHTFSSTLLFTETCPSKPAVAVWLPYPAPPPPGPSQKGSIMPWRENPWDSSNSIMNNDLLPAGTRRPAERGEGGWWAASPGYDGWWWYRGLDCVLFES